MVRVSRVHGRELLATTHIRAGEVVIIWGGMLFTAEQIAESAARQHSYAPVEEGLFLGAPADDPESPDDVMNHSCDPNVWLLDAVTLAARRGISIDEELTIDYATFNLLEWKAAWECNCGAANCRGTVTGRDYRLPELWERYGTHWSPFIRAHVAQERG